MLANIISMIINLPCGFQMAKELDKSAVPHLGTSVTFWTKQFLIEKRKTIILTVMKEAYCK